ncbi:hypothetical protein GF312_05365, partial [Candidatus Poribacteria bacterium]|nr:hypothetical protein [Candidatus Poribacteria bacterium]
MYMKLKGICIVSIFLCLLTPIVNANLEEGLVLYLPFDEGEGDTTQDLSPNGFVGTIEKAEWGEGKFGNALIFGGDGAFVEVPYNEAFDFKEGITMAAWVTANLP